MGRIAQALKRAEIDRQESIRLGLSPGGATAATIVAEPPKDTGRAPKPTLRDFVPTPLPPSGRPTAPIANIAGPQAAAVSTAPPCTIVDPTLVAYHDRASAVAEQYRAVRTWLLAHNSTSEHRILAMTSSVRGEGKTVTTGNLGIAMAEVRHLNTLLVDADLRRGSLGRLFGVNEGPGLTDVLAGQRSFASAVRSTPLENVSVLSAGALRGQVPTDLLSSRTAARLFDEIRERYHYVLVDTPSVQSASDVGVIGAMCTAVVLVVRLHKPNTTVVQESLRWLQANNLHVVGCIAVGAGGQARAADV